MEMTKAGTIEYKMPEQTARELLKMRKGEETKMTPNEYLVQFRIANACKLLKSSNVNISEAAYSSGYSDPLYFSRVFKKIKGITPTEFVKQQKRQSK